MRMSMVEFAAVAARLMSGVTAAAMLSGCPFGSGDSAAPQTFSLSSTVSGLSGSGLVLAVNGETVNVSSGAHAVRLATALAAGTAYTVSVRTQPSGQLCSVTGGAGTIGSANVANVVVTCSDRAYPVGGSVSGLNGAGLVLANGSDTLAVSAGATSFTLPTAVAYTSSYAVTVQTQPAGEACAVSNGTGTMPAGAVTNVSLSCTDQPFALGGTISGLGNNAGLVLANGSDTFMVPAGAMSFTMPTRVSFASPYAITVQSTPPGLTCTVSHAAGTMPAGNVTSVIIACSDRSYTVGGTISGLSASGLVLANGTDTLAVSAGASSFTLPTAVAYSSPYAVLVQTQPSGLTCTVSSGSGIMGTDAVTTVAVHCAANTYTIGGTVSGLTSSGLVLLDNGADATTINANATQFTMTSGETAGSSYAITVQTQPTGETCSVASATGTVGSANVGNVVVTCSDQAYALGGSVTGLNGTGLVLANGSDTLSVSAGATSFTMPTAVAYTSSYTVTVQTQPAGEACSVSHGSGTMPAGAVTSVSVSCTDQPFSLGGTISGLGNNAGLTLANGTDTLTVAAGATSFTMDQPVAFGSSYAVTVQSSPAGLTCTASNASGTMPASNVTSVAIACSDQSYTLGGSISGLSSSGLVLANGTDTLAVSSGASSFQMDQPVAYTSAYAVSVQTQPTGLTCSVSNGSGTMGTAAVTNIAITCSANTYTVGGTISGLTSSGLVLLDNGTDATAISANATQFTMNTGVAYGGAYAVTVQSQPAGLFCSVSNGTGTVGTGDVTGISITCGSNTVILYSFAGGSDGEYPYAAPIQGSDGNFYGTTPNGGAHGFGTVFKITPGGAESVLYSFAGGQSDGEAPLFGLIQASDGNFYGTTEAGGLVNVGTVFEMTPNGAESPLYSFGTGSGGPFLPGGSLVQGSDGNFYGTSPEGGHYNQGTLYEVMPSGSVSVLYSFGAGTGDAEQPSTGIILGSDGNFYGTSAYGGAFEHGVVFKVTPGGVETVLYSFAGGSDGASPNGLIQASDGNFYGTTYEGGANGDGTVFKVTASGTETVLYSFAGGSGDGGTPIGGLVQASDGNFYGTTPWGGPANDGVIFKLTPGGTETIMHFFAGGSDGQYPQSGLVQGSDGNLYGTTDYGGSSNLGTVFKVILQ